METRLPLTSVLENMHVHPLFSSILPVQSRMEAFERCVLLSPPAKLLARIGVPNAAIVLFALSSAGATVVHYRNHVRLILGLLGAAEGVARTIKLLAKIDLSDHEDPEPGEAKHVLSWWLLYALVSISSMRSRSPKSMIRIPPYIARILRRYSLMSYPPFPQPHIVGSQPLPLPRTQQLQRELVKMAILWIGLRRDGSGASILWDWVLGPIFAVNRKRNAKRRTVVVRRYENEEDELNPLATSTPIHNTRSVYISSAGSDDSAHHDSAVEDSVTTVDNFPTPQHVKYRIASSLNPVMSKKSSEDVAHEYARWE